MASAVEAFFAKQKQGAASRQTASQSSPTNPKTSTGLTSLTPTNDRLPGTPPPNPLIRNRPTAQPTAPTAPTAPSAPPPVQPTAPEPTLATFINPAGVKMVAPVGGQEAQQLFGQGFKLMGAAEGQQQPPAQPAPTGQQATLIDPNTGQKKVVQTGSQEAQQLFGQGYKLFTGQEAPPPVSDTTGKATLFNPQTGQKLVVDAGSQKAQELFGQGYELFTGQTMPGEDVTTADGLSPAEDLAQQEINIQGLQEVPIEDPTTPAQQLFNQFQESIVEAFGPVNQAQQAYFDTLANKPSIAERFAQLQTEQGVEAVQQKIGEWSAIATEIESVASSLPKDIKKRFEDVGINESQANRIYAKEIIPLTDSLDDVNDQLLLLQQDLQFKEQNIDRILQFEQIDQQDRQALAQAFLDSSKENFGLQTQLLEKQFELQNTEIQNRLAGEASLAAEERKFERDLVMEEFKANLKEVASSNDFARSIQTEILKAETGDSQELNKLLTPTEAAMLGVPFGTTRGEAAQQNLVPKTDLTGKEKIETERKMANDFDRVSKELRSTSRNIDIINVGFDEVVKALNAGDSLNAPSQAIITAFNKMLDPTSVVRESEYARSPEGQSLINKAQGMFDRLKQGGAGLSLNELKQFRDTSLQLQKIYAGELEDYALRTEQQAESWGLNIDNILTPDIQQILDDSDPLKRLSGLGRSFATLDAFNRGVDGGQEIIDEIKSLRPGITDNEILQFIEQASFSQDPSRSGKGLFPTGDISKKFESGGNPGAIGYDRTGGLSYGTYQLAHNNAKKYIAQSEYKKDFAGIAFNSQAWKNKWQEVAKRDPNGFTQSQHDYIGKTHYDPQVSKIKKETGVDIKNLNSVLQDVVWSTAVQHGAGNTVITNVIRNKGKGIVNNEVEFVKSVYNERWSGGRRFPGSTAGVRSSVKNRFFGKNGELNTAIAKLNNLA